METYGIAEYLEPEDLERAVLAHYVVTPEGLTRTKEDICPLGVALGLDYSPGSDDVAEMLEDDGHDYDAVFEAAESFIDDVDAGLIGPNDVAAALGVA